MDLLYPLGVFTVVTYIMYIVALCSTYLYVLFIYSYRDARDEVELRIGQHYHNRFIDIPNLRKSFPMVSVIIIAFCILHFKEALVWIAAMLVINMVSNILADRVTVNYYKHRYMLEIVRHSVSFWLTIGLYIIVVLGVVKVI